MADIMKCAFPGCVAEFTLATGMVPSLAVIREVEKTPVTLEVLRKHLHCQRHAAAGRRQGQRFHGYQQTVLLMETRRIEREQEKSHFNRYKVANRKEKKA